MLVLIAEIAPKKTNIKITFFYIIVAIVQFVETFKKNCLLRNSI